MPFPFLYDPPNPVGITLLRCSDDLEDLRGASGRFMSTMLLFCHGVLLIFLHCSRLQVEIMNPQRAAPHWLPGLTILFSSGCCRPFMLIYKDYSNNNVNLTTGLQTRSDLLMAVIKKMTIIHWNNRYLTTLYDNTSPYPSRTWTRLEAKTLCDTMARQLTEPLPVTY